MAPFDGTPEGNGEVLFVQSPPIDDRLVVLDMVERQLRTRGLMRGAQEGPDGTRCTGYAIKVAYDNHPNADLRGFYNNWNNTPAASVVLAAAQEITGRRFPRIEEFNDHRKTDAALVFRVLDRAREIIGREAEILPMPRRAFMRPVAYAAAIVAAFSWGLNFLS